MNPGVPNPSVPNADPTAIRVVCVVFHPGDELATFARTLATASAHHVELVAGMEDDADDADGGGVCIRNRRVRDNRVHRPDRLVRVAVVRVHVVGGAAKHVRNLLDDDIAHQVGHVERVARA